MSVRFRVRQLVSAIKGQLNYGILRPDWWPKGRKWHWGPSHPFDRKRVEFGIQGQAYLFEPSTYGRFRGHQCLGHLPAHEAEIARYLAADGHPAELARMLAATSSLEGGFDAIQTYDRAKFSWGFIQFSGTGSLIGALQRLKNEFPQQYEAYFSSHGVSVNGGKMTVRLGNDEYCGQRALDQLHDNPRLWKLFILAAYDPAIRHMQVRHAVENYYQRIAIYPISRFSCTLGELLGGTDWGRAVMFDRAVHGGMVFAARLFKHAASRCAPNLMPDPQCMLRHARNLDSRNARRWDKLERVVAAYTDD